MKIYALSEYDGEKVLGYYINKDLACTAAEEYWHETGRGLFQDFPRTFAEYWNDVCTLEEVTVVTEIEECTQ